MNRDDLKDIQNAQDPQDSQSDGDTTSATESTDATQTTAFETKVKDPGEIETVGSGEGIGLPVSSEQPEYFQKIDEKKASPMYHQLRKRIKKLGGE